MEGDRLYPVWAFLLGSGLRIGELVWLRWANVDLERRRVHIVEFASTLGYQLAASTGKSRDAVRSIELDDGLVRVLRSQRKVQAEERLASPAYIESDYVFTRPTGGPYLPAKPRSVVHGSASLRSREWGTERRLTWVIESETPATQPAPRPHVEPRMPSDPRKARQRLLAERQAILAAIPPDPTGEIRAAHVERRRLKHQRDDLDAGRGRYANHAIGHIVRDLERAEVNLANLRRRLALEHPSRRERRRLQSDIGEWQRHRSTAERRLAAPSAPEVDRLNEAERRVDGRHSELQGQRDHRKGMASPAPQAAPTGHRRRTSAP